MLAHPPRPMLLIEDSEEDYQAALWTLQRLHYSDPIIHCSSGDDALELLRRRGQEAGQATPLPFLIVLDLNLPGTDGREILRRIKGDPSLASIPVVVYSTSSDPRDIDLCYQAGANSYLVKPVDFDRFQACWRSLASYWSGCNVPPPTAQGQAR